MPHPQALTPRGYWRALERYQLGDIVRIDGRSWVAMRAHRARWWRKPSLIGRRNWVAMAVPPRQRTARTAVD